MVVIHNQILQNVIQSTYTLQDIQVIRTLLLEKGTFHFPTIDNGLFPAAAAPGATETGYAYVWVRDNIYVAYAHYILGQVDVAVKNVRTLMLYFRTFRLRFEEVIDAIVDGRIAMERPHIRFNGYCLELVDESWEHAQNDALGYFLWFYCKLAIEGHLNLQQEDVEILTLFPLYFQAIHYWEDEDSGHWEEGRKIEASSIGTVIAGLRALRQLYNDPSFVSHCRSYKDKFVTPQLLDELIEKGSIALDAILPSECIQPKPQERRYDAALLFLIYPLNVVREEIAEQILVDVMTNLQGDYGIRRYLKDSFWCRNFFTDLPQNIQTSISTEREQWLIEYGREGKEGEEAQWCLFDPIISAIFGLKFQTSRQESDLERQTHYLNRALGQITGEGRIGEYEIEVFKCPELYYIQDDRYIPNVSTPLLWTQANLSIALKVMEQNLRLDRG